MTVQKLVYMLDASLYWSFFARNQEGKVIGLDSNLGWHNEESGVFMINQDFKRSEQMQQELKEFELAVLMGEEEEHDNIQ